MVRCRGRDSSWLSATKRKRKRETGIRQKPTVPLKGDTKGNDTKRQGREDVLSSAAVK